MYEYEYSSTCLSTVMQVDKECKGEEAQEARAGRDLQKRIYFSVWRRCYNNRRAEATAGAGELGRCGVTNYITTGGHKSVANHTKI